MRAAVGSVEKKPYVKLKASSPWPWRIITVRSWAYRSWALALYGWTRVGEGKCLPIVVIVLMMKDVEVEGLVGGRCIKMFEELGCSEGSVTTKYPSSTQKRPR